MIGGDILAKVFTKVLDDVCPDCGEKIVSKTKKGFILTKTWLECPKCNKKWNNMQGYLNEKELKTVEETGILPTVYLNGAKLILKKNEIIHLHESPVTLLEERTKSYSYKSQSVGFRVKVAKNIYVTPRAGGGTIKKVETVIEKIDVGELYLTSKRLVFIGEKKTVSIPLKKIFAVEPLKDSIKIGREGKQRTEYFTTEQPLKWATFIKVAVSKL